MNRGLAHRVRRLEKRPVSVDAFSNALQQYVGQGVLPTSRRVAQAVVHYVERMAGYMSDQDTIANEALEGEQV